MEKKILPQAIFESVKRGVDATNPQNVLFKCAIIQFLRLELQKIQGMLINTPVNLSPPPRLPGTEKLPTIVENLLLALELISSQTPQSIKSKMEELEKGKGPIDAQIQSGIRRAIEDGFQILLNYLADPKVFQQILAQLIELARTPFSGVGPDSDEGWKAVIQKCSEDEKLLKGEAQNLVKRIIRDAVEKEVKGNGNSAVGRASDVLGKQKSSMELIFQNLEEICQSMKDKGQKSSGSAHQENEIQPHILAFASKMQEFSNCLKTLKRR